MSQIADSLRTCRPHSEPSMVTWRPGYIRAHLPLEISIIHQRKSLNTWRYGTLYKNVRLANPRTPNIAAAAASPSAVQLVSAAAVPVSKIALFCAVGAWSARRGLLTAESRRAISSLTLYIFTPCLLFSKLAVGVGLHEVARLWLLSANMVASHVVGLLLGLLAVKLARVPPRLRNQLVLSCGVGNVGNLPFVLLAGLAADPALPFAVALGPGLSRELAMRYVALSNLSAALIQFPLTYIFLQKPVKSAPELETTSSTSTPRSVSAPPKQVIGNDLRSSSSSSGNFEITPEGPHSEGTTDNVVASPTETAPATNYSIQSTSGMADTAATATAAALAGRPRWRSIAAGMLTPPTLFSLAAVVVASVDWLREALFSPGGCLRLLGELVDALGAVCIPLLLLVLGANLSRGPGVAAGRLPGGCIAAAVVTRLLLLPAVCGAALLGAWRAGLMPGVDPLAMLVMLVMHATPTAVLVHSMATIFGNTEDEVAAMLFWQYVACLLTLPLAIGLMLQLLGPAATSREAWLGAAGLPAPASITASAAAAAAATAAVVSMAGHTAGA
ncbi:hypothetical protein Vafri_12158 [Volvox africanus]|uniref:Auxin efflux carrier n=1 Tax=Volvox africanus TaxID=51714 RepID=A0A8J4B9E6_9CHLO|nr:hypothetical protein Vafri_12158 [Volvox africanus]